MCLELNGSSRDNKVKIAKKDIIVYKWLKVKINLPLVQFNHGDYFKAKINGHDCEGKVVVLSNGIFFCHDVVKASGNECLDKLGYLYSWQLDGNVHDILINGKSVQIGEGFLTPYKYEQVFIGNTYHSELIEENNRVNKGLHSFNTIDSAKYDATGDYVIVECTIPKGSKYYKGYFGANRSYASDTLIYNKII